jgi:hypothetical protein
MATYGIDDGALTYSTKAMKDYITSTQPAVDAENETDDFTTLGSSVEKQIYTGLTKYGEIPVAGPFDDTTTDGSDAVFGGAARAKSYAALVITWGGSKTTTFSAVGVKNYKRIIAKGSITNYEAVLFLGPGCTVTEA